MSIFVKICGLTDTAGVTAAVAAGADAVGFVFYEKSSRNISLAEARTLSTLVPEGILRVAVMLHPDPAICHAVLDGLRPDALQTDADDFANIELPDGVNAWPVCRESQSFSAGSMTGTFVYEGASSGQGQQVDWNKAAIVAGSGKMILAGGLDAANVAEAIHTVGPWGVDVSSAVESNPGEKDPAKIIEFVTAARAAS